MWRNDRTPGCWLSAEEADVPPKFDGVRDRCGTRPCSDSTDEVRGRRTAFGPCSDSTDEVRDRLVMTPFGPCNDATEDVREPAIEPSVEPGAEQAGLPDNLRVKRLINVVGSSMKCLSTI